MGDGHLRQHLAADIKGDWEAALKAGMSFDEAMKRLIDRYFDECAEDPDDGPTFWFAIAALELDLVAP